MSTELEPAIEDNGSDVRRFGWTADDLAACGIEPVAPEDDGPAAKEFISLTKSPATKIARAMVKAAHQQQVERVQRQAARKLSKYFQKSVRHITSRLFAESWEPDPEKAKSQAARLIKGAYDKDAQGDMLVDSASQPVADAFVEGAAAEMRLNAAARRRKAFNPDQPRNPDGTWGSGGSSSDTATDDTAREETDDERHQRQIQSPEFKAWFKDSKVVDDNDDPKVTNKVGRVYHGTGGHFTEFDAGKIGSNGLVAGKGFYFAESSRIARTYAEASGPYGKVLEAYLSIQNPYDFSSLASQSEVDKMRTLASEVASEAGQTFDASDYDKIISDRAEPDGTILRHNIWRAISEAGEGKINIDTNAVIQKAGYDGIVHVSGDSYGTPAHPAWGDEKGYGNVWIAFKPTQIKSATDNEGTFDPNSPDITKSVKVTTATQAAERAEEEIDFPTEMPEWLEEAALDFISHTFEEDYWLRIPETTRDDIEYTLEQGIEDGLSIREIARRIQEDHGSAYSKSRATMVARTEMTGAMNAGHTEGIRQAYEGTGVEPAKEFLSVMGTTTRQTHADADGQQRPVDEDFDIGGYPAAFPGDARLPPEERINCQCHRPDNKIIGNVLGGLRAFYSGNMAEVVTRSGAMFAVTPNHPVPTANRGMVPACELKKGDHVLLNHGPMYEAAVGGTAGDYVQHEPSSASEVFELLLSSATLDAVKVRSCLVDDLHGDGRFSGPEVEVVFPDSHLRNERQLMPQGQQCKLSLASVDVGAVPLSRPSTLTERRRLPSRFYAGLDSCEVPTVRTRLPRLCESFGPCSHWHATLSQQAAKSALRTMEFVRQCCESFAGSVSLDDVVGVSFIHYSGPVYDFQARNGTIFANGVLVSNCTVLSAFVGEGLEDDEEGKAFDPSQPRDDHGRWAADDGGTSIQGGAEPVSDEPASGGILKDNATAPLQERAAVAVRRSESLVEKAIQSGATVTVGITAFDSLSQEDQDTVADKWVDQRIDAYKESEHESWADGLGDVVRDDLLQDDDWAREQFAEIASDHGYTSESAREAFSGFSRDGVDYDADKLVLREEGQEEDLEAMEGEWANAIDSELETRINSAIDDGPPDSIYEDALAQAKADFDELPDSDKLSYAEQYLDNMEAGEEAIIEQPNQYEPISDGQDYERTRTIVRHLQNAIMYEEVASRGIAAADMIDADEVASQMWSEWKQSSTSADGLLLQYATSKELGSLSQKWSEEQLSMIRGAAVNLSLAQGGRSMSAPGDPEAAASVEQHWERGIEIAKAHVHGTWAATQYAMAKAGMDSIDVARGLMLNGDLIKSEVREQVTIAGGNVTGRTEGIAPGAIYERLPNLSLLRNGAASTTTSLHTANSWNGVGEKPQNATRVVLRISAPRESVVSLPAFGQNVHDEQEVVLAGTDNWKAWDAWVGRAPPMDRVAIKAARGIM